jgi:hypothetical protein
LVLHNDFLLVGLFKPMDVFSVSGLNRDQIAVLAWGLARMVVLASLHHCNGRANPNARRKRAKSLTLRQIALGVRLIAFARMLTS